LFKGYDNVVKAGANSKIPTISYYSRGLEVDTTTDWNMAKLYGSFSKGVGQAAYDTVDGIIKILIDPAETAEEIVNLLSLSEEDWLQIKDKVFEYFNKKVVNGTAEERAEVAGYVVFEAVLIVFSLSEIKKAKTIAGVADDAANSGKYSFIDPVIPDEAARYDAYWNNVAKGLYDVPYGMTVEEYYQYLKGLDKADSVIKSGLNFIDDVALKHSSIGDFTYNPKTGKVSRMKGGGHGQSNINFLENNGIDYNVVKKYDNGVRVGNIPKHKTPSKRIGTGQAWFPKNWTDKKIKNAGEFVANLTENKCLADGVIGYGEYDGVRVGIIKSNGKVGTIFPDADLQP
jgi:hypothetical protein